MILLIIEHLFPHYVVVIRGSNTRYSAFCHNWQIL